MMESVLGVVLGGNYDFPYISQDATERAVEFEFYTFICLQITLLLAAHPRAPLKSVFDDSFDCKSRALNFGFTPVGFQ